MDSDSNCHGLIEFLQKINKKKKVNDNEEQSGLQDQTVKKPFIKNNGRN